MRAAVDAAHPLAHGAIEAAADAQTNQLPEVGRNAAAHLIRRLIGHRLDIDDRELVVDRESDRHVMHEVTGLERAAPLVGVLVALLVGDAAFDVPEPILAEETLAGDATRVQLLSPDRRRKRHGHSSRKYSD